MSLGQNNGQQDLTLAQVWYAGTSVLQEGMAVAYDNDDTNAPTAPTDTLISGGSNADAAGQITFFARKNLRGRRVVDPATAVLGGFAGLVEASSAGVTGPAFITIVKPRKGDIVTGFCKVNATKNSTIVGITNAGGNNLVSVADATFNVDAVAIAYETKDTSTTAGPTLVRFL